MGAPCASGTQTRRRPERERRRGVLGAEPLKENRAKPLKSQEKQRSDFFRTVITGPENNIIEKNQRHVCDAELLVLAKALHVSMEWLVGDTDLFPQIPEKEETQDAVR